MAEENGEVVEGETPEAVHEEIKSEKPATAAEIAAAVAAVVRPATTTVNPDDQIQREREAEIARTVERTGKTREEVIADDEARRLANLRDRLPQHHELGDMKAEKIIGDDADLMEKVRAEVGKYHWSVKANPKAWEDAAHIVRSRAGLSAPKKKGAVTTQTDETPADKGQVLGGKTRVNPGLSEGTRGSGGGKKPVAKKEYDEFEQKIIDQTCGGNAEEYEKYKASGRRLPTRTTETVASKNKADLAEEVLTKGRRF